MERTLAEYLTHAPVIICRPDGEIVYWTGGARDLYGFTEDQALGRNIQDLLQTVSARPLSEISEELERRGEWQGLLRHTRADGRELWTESVWRLRGGDNGNRLVVVMNTDVTAREVLTRELNHRVKNTLAVIQGIARLTFGDADRDKLHTFETRLSALAKAHDLLMSGQWREAELEEVIETALAPFGLGSRVTLNGPTVVLRPNSVVAYVLAFHELTTNALKHGALSTPQGRVDVEWRLSGPDDSKLHLIWRERDGPTVKQPERLGFGAQLIQRAVASELGAPVKLRFEPNGVVCEFDGPVQKTPALPGQPPLEDAP